MDTATIPLGEDKGRRKDKGRGPHHVGGVLAQGYNYLFGDTVLVNEPTIDYNVDKHDMTFTIGNGRNQNENQTNCVRLKNTMRRNSNSASKPFRDLIHTSIDDEDVKRDLQDVYHKHDDTAMKIETLPYRYIGLDNKSSVHCSSRNRKSRRDDANPANLKHTRVQDEGFRAETLGSVFRKDTLEEWIEAIESKNQFLIKLNDLIDMSEKHDWHKDDEDSSSAMYNKLYSEYTEELIKCNKFYEAYYKLAYKYGELKRSYHAKVAIEGDRKYGEEPEAQRELFQSISDNLELIKTFSTKPLVLTKCDMINVSIHKYKTEISVARQCMKSSIESLNEKNNHLQSRCNYYQDELTKAKLKIVELERNVKYEKKA